MPESILVVDDDPDIARFVEVNSAARATRSRLPRTGKRRSRRPPAFAPISCCSMR